MSKISYLFAGSVLMTNYHDLKSSLIVLATFLAFGGLCELLKRFY
jgi:hypothetical protein